MRTVLCLSGLDTADFTRQALERLPAGVEIVLLYVIDTRPAEELSYVRRIHLFGGRTGSGHNLEMQEAERQLAAEVLGEARNVIESGDSPAKIVDQVVLEGRPERRIVDYLDQINPDMVVVGLRYRADLNAPPLPPPPPKHPHPDAPPPPPPKPGRGPHTIGPVTRFIIDHAGCDLLLLK
jgi:nucleotide-binding universal stress UspA family protein